jgi:hypothetical protein
MAWSLPYGHEQLEGISHRVARFKLAKRAGADPFATATGSVILLLQHAQCGSRIYGRRRHGALRGGASD